MVALLQMLSLQMCNLLYMWPSVRLACIPLNFNCSVHDGLVEHMYAGATKAVL